MWIKLSLSISLYDLIFDDGLCCWGLLQCVTNSKKEAYRFYSPLPFPFFSVQTGTPTPTTQIPLSFSIYRFTVVYNTPHYSLSCFGSLLTTCFGSEPLCLPNFLFLNNKIILIDFYVFCFSKKLFLAPKSINVSPN